MIGTSSPRTSKTINTRWGPINYDDDVDNNDDDDDDDDDNDDNYDDDSVFSQKLFFL